jgi:hypothetical protein
VLDLLRDPIWQFLGFIIGLLALVIGTWASLRGRAKKLTFEIISKTPLLNLNLDAADQRLKLSFRGKPLQNAEIALIKIINSGSTPIKPDDYEHPLRVMIGETSKILDAQVVQRSPNNLIVPLSSDESTFLAIDPILLNSGDYFVIQAITTPQAEISVDGRIAGVKEIKTEVHKRKSRRVMTTIFIWVVAIAIGSFIASGFTDYKTLFVVIAAGFSTFFGGVILPRLIDWIRDN